MIHLMPSYSTVGRGDISPSYYNGVPGAYPRDSATVSSPEQSPPAVPHSSFLIDDILGKKQREREAEQNRLEREREDERRRERHRDRETDSVIDRHGLSDRGEHRSSDSARDAELERLRVREREHELLAERSRLREIERERQNERDRDQHNDRHLHMLQESASKSLSSPPATATSLLPSDVLRPTPVNPAAIQTSALTTPTIFKPLPTLYDPSLLQQAAYMNPHLSACQSSLMRQMCGNIGSLSSIPGYTRHDLPAIFDPQYNAFSKGKTCTNVLAFR